MSLRHATLVPSLLIIAGLAITAEPPPVPQLPTPAQDSGLPYTRTARATALAAIKDYTVVCVGSRIAYAKGLKVRLDDVRWHDEAIERDGDILVPAAFAGVLLTKDLKPDVPPAYLRDKWTYTVDRTAAHAQLPTISVGEAPYVSLTAVAKAAKLQVFRHGMLAMVGKADAKLDEPLCETIITQFDTPEKLADPAIAIKYVPTLSRMGMWTEHAKHTQEQLACFNGDPVAWPTAPKESFDETGFNHAILGSKVPAPGVYPRLLFSPDDIPQVAARVKSSKIGQMSLIEMEHLFSTTWWNPTTSDGQLFTKLASGDLRDQAWPSTKPDKLATDLPAALNDLKAGIFSSHISYVPECLTAMATYCLVQGDDVHGRQAAAAIASYYRLIEPLVDSWNGESDSEFGSGSLSGSKGAATAWRGMHGLISHMNLGLSLDLAGKWMTADEKDSMRRVIAKATYGRRAYAQEGTVRFRDVNWMAWDLPHYLALAAIEGLEGFDREAFETNAESVRAFCDWGLDDQGVVFESNGKTPGSLTFFSMSLLISARRGDNLFGHPHLRKFMSAQAQMTSPTGYVIVNSGTQYAPYSRQILALPIIDKMKCFYPGDRAADYLLSRPTVLAKSDDSVRENSQEWIVDGFSPEAFRETVKKLKRLRLPSPSYPGFTHDVLFDTDWTPTERADTKLPLDFVAPTHGVLSTRSDQTTDATWLNMMVRPNHYMGGGHHHADAGMIHVSALGVDWFTQTRFHQAYDGFFYSLVQVDGHSEPENMPTVVNGYNGAATWLGATTNANGASAAADLTYAYSWRWMTQLPQIWSDSLKALPWEVEPSERIQAIYAGLGRFKLRPWWSEYLFTNATPTLRAPFNPMERVYRSTTLVRSGSPYIVINDDLKKDGQSHRYDWSAPLNGGVWKTDVKGLSADQAVLAWRNPNAADAAKEGTDRPAITPVAGEPLLLVASVGTPNAVATVGLQEAVGQADKKTKAANYFERLAISVTAPAVNFHVVLVPFRAGQPVPTVTWDDAAKAAVVTIGAQVDRLEFKTEQERTKMTVQRAGAAVIQTP